MSVWYLLYYAILYMFEYFHNKTFYRSKYPHPLPIFFANGLPKVINLESGGTRIKAETHLSPSPVSYCLQN